MIRMLCFASWAALRPPSGHTSQFGVIVFLPNGPKVFGSELPGHCLVVLGAKKCRNAMLKKTVP